MNSVMDHYHFYSLKVTAQRPNSPSFFGFDLYGLYGLTWGFVWELASDLLIGVITIFLFSIKYLFLWAIHQYPTQGFLGWLRRGDCWSTAAGNEAGWSVKALGKVKKFKIPRASLGASRSANWYLAVTLSQKWPRPKQYKAPRLTPSAAAFTVFKLHWHILT